MPTEEKNKTAEELELEQNADADGADDQGDDADEKDGQIDYEAELKLEREKREKAEAAAAKAAFDLRKAKRGKKDEDEEDDEQEDEDKPLTKKELEQALRTRDRSNQSAQSLQIAKGLTTSDAEAQLVVEYYNNRIVPSGDLQEDMEIAVAAVNRKKLIQERSEALRALGSKGSRTTVAANGDRVPADQAEPKVSADEAKAFKSAGYKWNAKNQRHELDTGKRILYVDPRSGERGSVMK